jgi:hypothetical protein
MNPRSPLLSLPSLQEAMDLAITTGDKSALVAIGLRDSRRNAQPRVDALLAAGWAPDFLGIATPDPEPFQWRWRRPPRGKARRGRLFASTGQAYNALMRERGDPTLPARPGPA